MREATEEDHDLLKEEVPHFGIKAVTQSWVSDNEEGQRYWVVARPYAFGQIRLQMWLERYRGETYPDIFWEL